MVIQRIRLGDQHNIESHPEIAENATYVFDARVYVRVKDTGGVNIDMVVPTSIRDILTGRKKPSAVITEEAPIDDVAMQE